VRRAALCAALLVASAASAGPADVVAARAEQAADGTWRFVVSVRHADEGWDHFADRWEVLAPDGAVLATRELRHPHVDEQPFTRDLAGVRVPPGVTRVRIRARDSRHGLGGRELDVELR
jgi:hypothetical protein